jgi:predicted transcriptional regulator
MKKTQLQMSVRLNYQTFLKYLEWLKNCELVKVVTDNYGNDKIMLSEKGIESHRRLVG